MWEQIQDWDRELFVFLNNLGIERFDAFWIFVTNPRHWIPVYILFFVFFFMAWHWRRAVFTSISLLCTVLSTWLFTNLVKGYFVRLRPNNNPDLADLIRILQEPTNYSFFSGHAATSFAATTFIVLVLRHQNRWIYLAYIWPILFVMSRIYVGVHYPGDILVGALVGVTMALIFYRIYLGVGKRYLPLYFSGNSKAVTNR